MLTKARVDSLFSETSIWMFISHVLRKGVCGKFIQLGKEDEDSGFLSIHLNNDFKDKIRSYFYGDAGINFLDTLDILEEEGMVVESLGIDFRLLPLEDVEDPLVFRREEPKTRQALFLTFTVKSQKEKMSVYFYHKNDMNNLLSYNTRVIILLNFVINEILKMD